MTPTQLRAYVAVVRLGSVKQAAAQLEVSEAAVSLHIGQLRKEFGDQLFSRKAAGLAFTPGGLRLASRAAELLGLQDRTVLEVSAAGRGRRLLRVAASSLFAELAAPGLIELFAKRAADLDVELSVRNPGSFETLLLTRAADIAVGPQPPVVDTAIACRPVMNYRLVIVVGPDHPLAGVQASPGQLRDQTWLLGPSAATDLGAVPAMLRRLAVPTTGSRSSRATRPRWGRRSVARASRRRCRSPSRRTSARAISCCWLGRTRRSRPSGIRWCSPTRAARRLRPSCLGSRRRRGRFRR
ncbi:LysR family transcriptional regulator [Micromonospora sp. RTP1Z1]|uniref:LysR family transcriptional regulator n=1 Tax=Micromonospora sp. RTP1Z1 TaxID=2994043 RepID=UPI0029C7AA7D|nr:LysR family transcriptional regulator [Micromonospora sp. RTP1Z1]